MMRAGMFASRLVGMVAGFGSGALAGPAYTADGIVAFSINGYTDGTGSERSNLSLSERRAKAVVSYLGSQGADRSKLLAYGYGKLKPKVADPLDPANRRVETQLRTE